jgi:hypothetical protein
LEFHIPRSNPSIRDSANAVNARLSDTNGNPRLFLDGEKCPDVILSIEGAAYKPGTLFKDDSTDRKPNSKVKTHFADTVRYLVHGLYPILPTVVGIQYRR